MRPGQATEPAFDAVFSGSILDELPCLPEARNAPPPPAAPPAGPWPGPMPPPEDLG